MSRKKKMFQSGVYKERRKKLKTLVGKGLLIFLGNQESSINYVDNHYRFRQDSTFLYFFGIDKPGLAAIIDIDNDRDILFGKGATMDDVIWTGPQPSLEEYKAMSGMDDVLDIDSLKSFIEKAGSSSLTHYLPPYRPEHTLRLGELLERSSFSIEKGYSESLIRAIISLRSIKSAEEIQELHKAGDITGRMHLEVMKAAKAGMKEAALAGIAHKEAIAGGGDLSFTTILTKNGQTLHNHYHGNTIENGDLILVDCGAETDMGYAGDMTRTFPVNGRFSNRQKEIYTVVLEAQKAAIEALKPGLSYLEIHQRTAGVIVEGLKSLGLMKGDSSEAVKQGAYALFMPHGLGHMTGLDVHDMENLGEELVGYSDSVKRSEKFGIRSLRLGKILETGFTLTVEPGIYFIPDLIDKWKSEKMYRDFIDYEKLEEYRNFGGIRIEEDFLITENGSQLLGMPLAKSIEEIETIRQNAEQ